MFDLLAQRRSIVAGAARYAGRLYTAARAPRTLPQRSPVFVRTKRHGSRGDVPGHTPRAAFVLLVAGVGMDVALRARGS